MFVQLKHAMNSVGDAVHRFALPKRRRKQRSKRALDYGGWTESIAVPFMDLLDSREAEFTVSSSSYRDRVMEARFDVYMIRLLHGVRAFDGSMFRREAWDVRSGLNTGTCCSRHHIAKGPVGGVLRLELGPSHRPSRAGT